MGVTHLTSASSLNCSFLTFAPFSAPFFKILLVPEGWLYAKVGGCNVENPRWLRQVLRTVGLIGDGEIGVRGSGVFALEVLAESAGTASESFGRAARASIMI